MNIFFSISQLNLERPGLICGLACNGALEKLSDGIVPARWISCIIQSRRLWNGDTHFALSSCSGRYSGEPSEEVCTELIRYAEVTIHRPPYLKSESHVVLSGPSDDLIWWAMRQLAKARFDA